LADVLGSALVTPDEWLVQTPGISSEIELRQIG
jgi:hypothetical protein